MTMDVLLLLGPLLVSGVLSLIIVKKRAEHPKAKPGRMPLMLLLLIPLTLGCTYVYYLSAYLLALFTESLPCGTVLLVICLLLLAYFMLLAGRGLARLLSLTKKNRMASLAVMLLLLLAETYASYVYISGNYI